MGYVINAAAVMIGGALGALARFRMDAAITHAFMINFPVGTLCINVLGGLLMGLLQGVMKRSGKPFALGYNLLGTGFLGGFTTFSHFSLDVFDLWRGGQGGLAALYALLSLALCIGAVWLGYRLMCPRRAATGAAA
ncbi:fluoride efflux transporter CrcB [Desulfovibrio sp. ZJ200]|uniref:fluoride efflux transporter CrcB n=1 Tax=Desulfovibrio sp. ZJ200 TaxID=2709792 RepID=UPI00197F2A6E|nr:fluoride efflux transporter CrcB [Desulfovibrio sp. ZJ200]